MAFLWSRLALAALMAGVAAVSACPNASAACPQVCGHQRDSELGAGPILHVRAIGRADASDDDLDVPLTAPVRVVVSPRPPVAITLAPAAGGLAPAPLPVLPFAPKTSPPAS